MTGRRYGLGRSQDGGATVEFALVAPLLIMSVLSMTDIGLATHQLFRIDQTLRNAAEAAIRDPGEGLIDTVLSDIGAEGGADFAEWRVERRCACPSTSGTETCGTATTCDGGRPMSIYYDISGSRLYRGILLPDWTLTRTASVQVR